MSFNQNHQKHNQTSDVKGVGNVSECLDKVLENLKWKWKSNDPLESLQSIMLTVSMGISFNCCTVPNSLLPSESSGWPSHKPASCSSAADTFTCTIFSLKYLYILISRKTFPGLDFPKKKKHRTGQRYSFMKGKKSHEIELGQSLLDNVQQMAPKHFEWRVSWGAAALSTVTVICIVKQPGGSPETSYKNCINPAAGL